MGRIYDHSGRIKVYNIIVKVIKKKFFDRIVNVLSENKL